MEPDLSPSKVGNFPATLLETEMTKDTDKSKRVEREQKLVELDSWPLYAGETCMICEIPIPGYNGPLCDSCSS